MAEPKESFLTSPRPLKHVDDHPKRAQTTCVDYGVCTLVEKNYRQQYSDMYYLSLSMLKPTVLKLGHEAWDDLEVRLPRAAVGGRR